MPDSCDCGEFGQPLAKKMLGMNLQQNNSQVVWSTSVFVCPDWYSNELSYPVLTAVLCQQAEGRSAGEGGGGEQEFLNRYPFPKGE